MRGWRNTVEAVLFEISNSMKPYPSVCHAYINYLRPVICLFKPKHLDELSNRIPPTSQGSKHSGAKKTNKRYLRERLKRVTSEDRLLGTFQKKTNAQNCLVWVEQTSWEVLVSLPSKATHLSPSPNNVCICICICMYMCRYIYIYIYIYGCHTLPFQPIQ